MIRLVTVLATMLMGTLALAQATSLSPTATDEVITLSPADASATHGLMVPGGVGTLFVTLTLSEGVSATLAAPDSTAVVTPTLTEADTVMYEIPAPTPGTWQLTFSHDQAKERIAYLEVFYAGATLPQAGVLLRYDQVQGPVTVSVAVLQGGTAVPGADVTIAIRNGVGATLATAAAFDDGSATNADLHAGDGLYSASISGLEPGFYTAEATVTLPALPTLRASALFEVFARTGTLDGSMSEAAVDDDSDGLLDRVAFTFGVNAVQGGEYAVEVLLRATNGKEAVTRNGYALLPAGASTISTDISTRLLRDRLGVDGPYEIVNARLLWTPSDPGVKPMTHIASELHDLGYTQAYDIAAFDRPYLVYVRYAGEEGIDLNGNGQIDVLLIEFEIDSAIPSTHHFSWNARLFPVGGLPADGRDLFAANGGTIAQGSNVLTLEFAMEEYGVNSVSGPFEVRDPSLYPTSALPSPYGNATADRFSDLPTVLGVTAAYRSSQLEGGAVSTITGLIEYVTNMPIDHPGRSADALRSQLLDSLHRAQDAADAGRQRQVRNHLNAFLNKIHAQAGKAIAAADATSCQEAVSRILETL